MFSFKKSHSKSSAKQTDKILEKKLKLLVVKDIDNFWEMSNSISEGNYERVPTALLYDDALNSSVVKVKTRKKEITHFISFNPNLGYEIFTLEDGQKVIRGDVDKIINLYTQQKPLNHILNTTLKSLSFYKEKEMRIIAIAFGYANEWNVAGFAVFGD